MNESASLTPTETVPLNRGYFVAMAAAAVLSTTAIFIRYLTQTYHLPALVLAVWRAGFVVLTLLPVLAFTKPELLRAGKRQRLFLIGYGLTLALFNTTWTLSVSLNGAAVATVLAYVSTAFTVLLGRIWLKEALTWPKVMAVVLSLSGCALISGALHPEAWNTNLMGILTGLLSGLGYAVYSLMGRAASQRGLNPWTSLFHTFSFATLFLLLFNLFPAGIVPGTAARPADFVWLGDAWFGWLMLFLLAAGPTVAGFGLYNVSLSLIPSSVANLIVTMEPIFTTLVAYFLLGERLTATQIFGGMLILSGVVILTLGNRNSAVSTMRK
ncbi:MAG: DMT family transporter [Anaerolineales bacterium]|nr:DMT family transporter [Anaerolineales bacterium]